MCGLNYIETCGGWHVVLRRVFLCNRQFLFIMTGVSALNDQVSFQVRMLALTLNILCLNFCFLNFWVSCSLSCFFMRALLAQCLFKVVPGLPALPHTQQLWMQMVLFGLFHSLPWIVLFQLSRFGTTAQTCMIAGTTVEIVVGRRFVLIRAELRRVDRIQRGGKEEDIYPPSQSCRWIRKTVKKRLEKQPVSGLWIMKVLPSPLW